MNKRPSPKDPGKPEWSLLHDEVDWRGRGAPPFADYAVLYSPKSGPVTMWHRTSMLEGIVAMLRSENRRVTCDPVDVS